MVGAERCCVSVGQKRKEGNHRIIKREWSSLVNMQAFLEALEECFRRIQELAAPVATTGESFLIHVRGLVVGRSKDEDVELDLDHACEVQFYSTLVLEYRLPIYVIGEHGDYGNANSPYILIVDPFDGTGPLLRMRPYRASVYYSACTLYDGEGKPCAGGCLDIVECSMYLAHDGRVEKLRLDDGTREPMAPCRATSLSDAVVACYTMRTKYLRATMERAGSFFGTYVDECGETCDVFPGFLHPTGGSFMGAIIAVGKENVSAYILGNELYSETVPGGAFITAAGLSAVVVNADGTVLPFLDTFNVQEWRGKGDLYRGAPRMHLFLMSATHELLREMLRAVGVSESGPLTWTI